MKGSSPPVAEMHLGAMRTPPDPEHVRACLQAWFDAHAQPVQVESLASQYVVYLPGTDFSALYTVTLRRDDDTESALLFANIHHPDTSTTLVDKAVRRAARGKYATPRLGSPAYHLPELAMAVWTYPNDPKLKTLGASVEPEVVRAALACLGGPDGAGNGSWQVGASDRTLVRYIPRKRVVFRYEIEWRQARGADGGPRSDPSSALSEVYAKVYEDGADAGQVQDVTEILWRAAHADRRALRVPKPLHFDVEHGVLYQSALPGELLVRRAEAVTPARVADIARGLALLQQLRLPLRGTLRMQDELEKTRESARLVTLVYPDFEARVADIVARLETRLAQLPRLPLVPCHGTFKLAHLLDDGARTGLVDFDSMVFADPLYDVANFIADLHYLEANGMLQAGRAERLGRAFHEAWCAQVPWGRRDAALDWYVASLLLRKQALKPVKHLHPDAEPKIGRVLEAARRRLGE